MKVHIKDLRFGQRIWRTYKDDEGIEEYVVFRTYMKDGAYWVDCTDTGDYEFQFSEWEQDKFTMAPPTATHYNPRATELFWYKKVDDQWWFENEMGEWEASAMSDQGIEKLVKLWWIK